MIHISNIKDITEEIEEVLIFIKLPETDYRRKQLQNYIEYQFRNCGFVKGETGLFSYPFQQEYITEKSVKSAWLNIRRNLSSNWNPLKETSRNDIIKNGYVNYLHYHSHSKNTLFFYFSEQNLVSEKLQLI